MKRVPAGLGYALFAAAAVCGVSAAGAQAPAPHELKKMSLEELFDLEVTSVSRRPEKLSRIPLAIQVITAEDMRRAGVTRHGRIIEFNPVAEKAFGRTRAEATGRLLTETLIPPALREHHRAGMEHCLATGEGPVLGRRIEMTAVRADGAEFPVELSINASAVDGESLFTAYLRDAKERAEPADNAKSAFLASMSHELRTPRNAIMGFTGTLLMRLPGAINEGQEKQLRTVQSSARHLLSLINDLLDLAKIESGKVELNLTIVNCQSVSSTKTRPGFSARSPRWATMCAGGLRAPVLVCTSVRSWPRCSAAASRWKALRAAAARSPSSSPAAKPPS